MNSWYIDRSKNFTLDGIKESLAIVDVAGVDKKKLTTESLVNECVKSDIDGNVINSPAALTRFRDHGLLQMDNTMGDSARLYYEEKYNFGELIIDLFLKRFTRKEEYTTTRPFVILCMLFSNMMQMGLDEDDIFLTVHECHKYLLEVNDYSELSFELVEQIISERKYSYSKSGRAIQPCVELDHNGSSFYKLYFNALKETPLFISNGYEVSVLKPNMKQKEFFRYISENADEFEVVSIKNNTQLYQYYGNRKYGFAEILPSVVRQNAIIEDENVEKLYDYLFGYNRHSDFEYEKYLKKECFGAYFAFISVPGIAIAKIRDDNEEVAEKLYAYSQNNMDVYVKKLDEESFEIQTASAMAQNVEYSNEAAFKSWMRSQTKLSGEPYFTENTVGQYISAIKAVSNKFNLSPVLNIQTVEEFDSIDQLIRNNPGFEKFNKNRGNGALSAGLVAYRKFLVSPKSVDVIDVIIPEEDTMQSKVVAAWYVGAKYDNVDHTDTFIEEGIWKYIGERMSVVDSVKTGDRIAIKAMCTQKHGLPFENYGKDVSCIIIKAIGTVKENKNHENTLVVDWEKLYPEKRWYAHTGKLWGTATKLTVADGNNYKNLLAFTFEGKEQPYEDIDIQPNVAEQSNDLIATENEEVEETISDFNYEEIPMSPQQIIYFGAPGTGKSFEVDKILKTSYENEDDRDFHSSRVVFHPDYTYSDFVGSIRPIKPEGGTLTYDFVPGPFTELLKKSFIHYKEQFYLVLEEINRGNAAAIFGDLFQLLDRKDELGKSKYRINNADIAGYLRKDKRLVSLFESNKIWLPSNFNIICTMNTADQNVFVLDSAFKRRFGEEYTNIDFTKLTKPLKEAKDVFAGTIDLKTVFANTNLKSFVDELALKNELNRDWATFAKIVNHIIDEINEESGSEQISEDKKLGPFFVTVKDLSNRKNFVNKVVHYLKQDVFKYVDFYFAESYQSIYAKYAETNADVFVLLKRQGE